MFFINENSQRQHTQQLIKHLKSTLYVLLTLQILFITPTYAIANSNDKKAMKFEHYRELKNLFKQQKILISPKTNKPITDKTIRIIIEADKAALLSPSSGHSNPNMHDLETEAHSQGIKIHRKLERFNLLALNVTENQLDKLVNNDKVLLLSEDRILEPVLEVSVPHIGGDILHNAGFTGEGQAVAILDTGVDEFHPFFGNRIVEEACFSSGDEQDFFTLCPNKLNTQIGKGAGRDCSAATGVSSCIHGTHVAGIAAGGNSTMAGTAPSASIISVQVFTLNPATGRISAFTSDIIAAFEWLIHDSQTTNLAAINLSLGSGAFSDTCDDDVPALTSAIQTLRERGVATVIASGNSAKVDAVSWPSCISSAVTVGASLRDQDIIASFTNLSPIVDLIAPGDDILSSIPGGTFTILSGTSMATPHITGAFAAFKSLQTDSSIDLLEQTFKQTGVMLRSTTGINLPRIDMAAAYEQLKADAGYGNNNCSTAIPGDIEATVGALDNGSEKSWSVFAPQGGLFRVRVSSAASSGGHVIQVTLNGNNVVLSVGAGGTTLADFANVNAGPNTFKISALSEGVILGRVWIEQLAGNNTTSTDSCSVISPPTPTPPAPTPPPAPNTEVIGKNIGAILKGTEKVWQLSTESPSNIRISISSTSPEASRRILVTLDNVGVDISVDSNATVPIDFPNLAVGSHRLAIKAINDNVIIGEITASNF